MKAPGNQNHNEYHKTDKRDHFHDLFISTQCIEEIIHNMAQRYWIESDRKTSLNFHSFRSLK